VSARNGVSTSDFVNCFSPFSKISSRSSPRHFTDNGPGFVAGRIRKRDVKVAACLDFHSNYAPGECEPIILNAGTL